MKNDKTTVKRWYATSEYVDVDTGEILTRSQFERLDYVKLKTTKKYEINGNIGIIKHQIECEVNRQKKLF